MTCVDSERSGDLTSWSLWGLVAGWQGGLGGSWRAGGRREDEGADLVASRTYTLDYT